MSANDNGPPTWQEQLHEQSYGLEAEPKGESQGFDPGEHTVAEVEDYVTANPNERQAVLDAETAGKNRTTLVSWLEES